MKNKTIRRLQFSDYIVYVDESGSPSLKDKNPAFPVFVLTFVIVSKESYRRFIIPAIQDLKFEIFGHDMVNLHSYEIRQKENDFTCLMDNELNERFMERLNDIMQQAYFVLVCSVFNKNNLKEENSRDMYHMALQFCLERLNDFLLSKNQHGRLTHIIAEGRGKREDKLLKEEFDCVLSNAYDAKQSHKRDYTLTPMELKFAKKAANSTGLQLADLVGRPVGSHVAFPQRENRAYDVIANKFFRKGKRKIGLKISPKN